MTFEELEHTADVLVRVRGATIDEVFSDAARAMFHVIYGSCDGDGIVEHISLESDNLISLLHDFLSELLFITDAENIVFCSFDVDVTQNRLSAVMKGVAFDPSLHSGGTIIKGISLSGLRIVKEEDAYVVEILFDV
jgi:SHS2 domain-containing protein